MCLEKVKAFTAQQAVALEKVHDSLDTLTQFTTTAALNAQVHHKITAFFRNKQWKCTSNYKKSQINVLEYHLCKCFSLWLMITSSPVLI